jgi:hypothetical protein
MSAAPSTAPAKRGPNIAYWLIWILPSCAVAGSFTSLYFAVHGMDPPLPAAYHWEGQALDADQSRQAQARSMGIAALLQFDAATGHCRVKLQGDSPGELRVDLAHPTRSADDRHWVMKRDGDGYQGECGALPKAHWWVQIGDPAGHWQLRGRVKGDFQGAPVYLAADSREG